MIEGILNQGEFTKADAIRLLSVQNTSNDFYELISFANTLSRRQYENRGYIFAQIGINSSPCPGACKFCSLANSNFTIGTEFEKSLEQVVDETKEIIKEPIDALFLMTTADYDRDKFLEIGKNVKRVLGSPIDLVANVGDFDLTYAERLKAAGFNAVYHICRLREGIDTNLNKEDRISTLEAVKNAGLELYYCVEPIGSEHTYEELVDEMFRAKDLGVNVMAVMRRVNVPGTKFENLVDLSELEIAKISAVARIVTNPQKSMCVHEPMKMPLLAGCNQLYAEFGINPRDNEVNTEQNRGNNVATIRKMLQDAEWSF
jgi:biotin synthase